MISSRRIFGVQAAFAVVLLFFVAVQASRVVDRHWGARLRLGGAGPAALKPATLAYLGALRGRVTLTYFVSSRSAMPSSLKTVEDEVVGLLQRLRNYVPEKLDIRVLDPDAPQDPGNEPVPEKNDSRQSDPDSKRPPGNDYASAKAVSPIKVRRVLADESSEAIVWSSLTLAHDQQQDGLIQGITTADLPHLEDLIVETLKASESTAQPVIAVASPGRGYASVREFCSTLGGARVISLDLDRDPRLPLEADLLIWAEPRTLTRDHALELERFLATGRSAIVAGSTYSIDYLARDAGKLGYRVTRSSADWELFLRRFGLGLKPLLTIDKNREEITWRREGGSIKLSAPFHIRVNPSLFDTKNFLGPNAGALLVSAVSPITWDPRAVAASGRRLEVVATTSESARVMELPDGEFDDAGVEGALAVPKQPWMTLLKPLDPWKGDLLVAGSPILFHDDPYAQGGNANQTFLRTLLRTYTAPQRLARIRVPRNIPPMVPELSLASRVAWRTIVILAVPIGLLLVALRRARSAPLGRRRAPWLQRVAAGAAALAVLLLSARLLGGLGILRIDTTEDSLHTPSPLSERLLAGARDGLEVEVIASEGFRMPSDLKRVEPRVLGALRNLGFRPRVTRPEDLPTIEQQKLEAAGVVPFEIDRVENDTAASGRVWSALRLSRGGKSEIVPRLDARTVEHLEFLLSAAVKRLAETRAPVVGVLSDLPRLSPAEAHSDYQQKGYTAPVGSDVYSLAKRMLESYGYRVLYINPETPVFPEKMDVLVWLQPRFPQRSWPQLTKFMSEGGKAVVAVQHYNVQQRQFRGAGFKTVYWPQPQFHGLNDYLKLIGVQEIGDKQGEQPGEVLFDRQHSDLVLETQVNRSAFREHDPQQVSLPFLIRAAGDGLSAKSVVTSRLGSLLFIWGNRFSADDARLEQLGMTREILVTTSPRVWTFGWSGGWIPEKSFQEPESPADFLRDLEAFVAIADSGSLTAAAQQLLLSQRTLSARIVTLEVAFDAKLFDSEPGKVRPTPTGEVLLPRARAILQERDPAQAVEAFLGRPTGLPRVGASSIPGSNLLPRVLLPGPQPLAMLLDGKFPRMEVKKDESGREALAILNPGGTAAPQAPGKMVLIGCSEMFKNAYLEAEGFQHDQFLLNAVAFLAHGPELAEIQARRRVPKVFPYRPSSEKALWRMLVVGLPPALFVIYGIARAFWRRKPLLGGPAS